MIQLKNIHTEESVFVTETQSYSWLGEKFTLRPNQQIDYTIQNVSSSPLVEIEDEDLGAVVIIENITLLNEFLVGPARRPFLVPRKDYVIVLRYVHENWRSTAAAVLQRLWENYGIYKILLMAPCNDSTENVNYAALKPVLNFS